MKRLFLFLALLSSFFSQQVLSQPADGAIADDFTFTDINGNTQNLYSYLNQGKYVAMDLSTTWCHPCWDYHVSGVMDSLYNIHDLPGDHTWKVLFIEVDGTTDSADLHGTGTNTVGNWVQGSNYTIIDPPAGAALNNFLVNYNINFYPTLLMICPDKRIVQSILNVGAKALVNGWDYAANTSCLTAGIQSTAFNNPISVSPNPAKDFVTLHIELPVETEVILSVNSITGQQAGLKNYGKLNNGEHDLMYDTKPLSKGLYFFSIYYNNTIIRNKVAIE